MLRQGIAEALGTFFLVFLGTGAILVNRSSGGAITHAGIAFTFGAAVFLLILLLGHVSGAHMNPAVSLSQALLRRLPLRALLLFLPAQVLGALLASGLLRLLFPVDADLGATLPAGPVWQSWVLEFLLTGLLLLLICSCQARPALQLPQVAAAIGMLIGVEALVAGPLCGASMNPARSLAPALVSGQVQHLWVYLTAPVCGALAGAFLGAWLFPLPSTETKS